MAIKVVVHWPEDPKAMQQLKENQAKAVLHILESMLSSNDLDTLMKQLQNERLKA